MTRPTALASATWVETAKSWRRALLVPLGACEQHGPHLPFDTDVRIAAAVAHQAAASRTGVRVAPALPFGASGEHSGFTGTLSIGREALAHVLVELGRDATRQWEAVLFVNSHGGNAEAIAGALAVLADEGRRCAVHSVTATGGDAHAGRTETSLLLHLAPELVRVDEMVAGEIRPITELMPRLRREGVRAVSHTGVLGDPTGASAHEGSALLDELAERCGACIDVLCGEVG